jgi:drug/metabolite transporter (DMT)-like permease
MNTAQTSDYLKLHFIVFLWGSTAVIGKLISIPAVEMIFYRMLLASLGMIALMLIKKESFLIPTKDIIKLLLVGILVSTHWIAFFGSGQVSTASVSLVGFATASLWTAIIEPLSNRKKIQPLEIGLGFFVIAGLYIIFSFDFDFFLGLGLGILSGLLLAIFAVINSHLVRRIPSTTITMYEMLGGFLFTSAVLPIYKIYWAKGGELQLSPTQMDWLYISILAIVCSVYAYSLSVELMKKISVFTIQLALNLEPVYGIIMAVILLNEGKYLNTPFYIGTTIILLAVLLYPYLKNRFVKSDFA